MLAERFYIFCIRSNIGTRVKFVDSKSALPAISLSKVVVILISCGFVFFTMGRFIWSLTLLFVLVSLVMYLVL